MTFYEAALRVLEEAGTPLLSTDITKRAIEKGLLSHIGKTPEITMLSRLAAMAKRPRDRKLQVTARDTFALTDWMLPEDPEALTATGVIEPNPEEALPPYRPTERHPEAHAEYLRSIGRQSDRKRRDDDRKKKFPPIAEVAFEVLQEAATALVPAELLARIKAREGAADDCSVAALIDGLAADNQKRLDESRKPAFAAVRSPETNDLQLSLEPQAEGGPSALEVQTSFCGACNLPFENGKVTLKRDQQRPPRPERGERAERGERGEPTVSADVSPEDLTLIQTARHAGKDARKAMARVLRKKLSELDLGTFEKASVRMMHGLHFRELKVARRSKDGPLLTARRREGSLEIRYAVRLLKGGGQVERRHVQELRRELQQTGANVGLLITAGEARGDARSECTTGPLVMLWAGDALSDKFFEAKVGVSVTTIELFDIDEAFFAQAKLDADESLKRREERQRERGGEAPKSEGEVAAPPPSAPNAESANAAATVPDGVPAVQAAEGGEEDDGEEDDDGEEGGEEASAEPGTPGEAGEGKRRRRRRRRRRRGGARPDGAPAEGGVSAAPAAGAPAPVGEASAEAPVAEAAPAPEVESAPVAPPPPPASEPT